MSAAARGVALATAALVAGALVAAGPADAAPAQSTKILRPFSLVASAVDNAGGSLVAGVERYSGDLGLFLYHRSPTGAWDTGTEVPLGDQDPVLISDVQAIAGDDGFYVVTWLTVPDDDVEHSSVWSVTRSPSESVSAPTKVFDTDSGEPLRMGGNTAGDAAVTQLDAGHVARYLRGTGWTTLDAAVDQDPGGEQRSGAIVMMSAARTVDLTFRYPGTNSDTFVQLTRTSGAPSFTRRTIYTAPDDHPAAYGIAMDANGLQTLVTDDADDAIKVYREQTRRGPFVYRWRKPRGNEVTVARPYVSSAGRFTRVIWYAHQSDGSLTHTRLYDGTSWASTRSATGPFGDGGRISTPLGIGTDGRGVGVGVQGSGSTVYRSLLETASRTDSTVTTYGGGASALDVGTGSVSQLVFTETQTETHDTRTVVLVRR